MLAFEPCTDTLVEPRMALSTKTLGQRPQPDKLLATALAAH